MTLLPGLLQPTTTSPAAQAATRVQLTLPPAARTQLEQQLQTLPLPQLLTVGTANEDGTTPLTLGNGTVVNVKISPPLNPGSQVTVAQLPAASEGEASTILTAQLTLAAAKGVRASAMQTAVQQVLQGKVPTPPTLNLANVQVVGGNMQVALPNVLPQGPILVTMPMPQVVQLLQQLPAQTPLQLLPNGQPMTAEGQPAFLSGGGLPRFVPVTVQAGQPLPTNMAVALMTADATLVAPKGLNMLMTLATGTPFTPPAATAAASPVPSKVQIEGLKLLFGQGGAPVLPPAGTPFAARILTPPLPAQAVAQLGLPAGTLVQTAVLSTGSMVQVTLPPVTTGQSPNPLPAGTVLTMALDFTSTPVSNAPTVLRLSPANAQPQPNQPNPNPAAQHTQTQVLTVQAPPPVGTLVQATVTGQTAGTPPQALITLNTAPFAGQTFTLPTGQTLPVGTQVQLQFGPNLQATLLNFVLPPNFMRSQAATTLAHQWPQLTQALNATPTQQAAQHIPTPQNFLATFLPYAKALMEGKAEVPLTKEAAMKAAAVGLDFTPDLQLLTALAAKPDPAQQGADQWRGVLFPYIENAGDDPRQGRFFWRQQKQDEQREDSKPSTRFVLEFSLTNMGDLQLDGLVTYPEIWLKLRGHRPFEQNVRTEIGDIVRTTLEGLGLTGGISLEEAPVFPLNPLAELLREDPTSLNLSL